MPRRMRPASWSGPAARPTIRRCRRRRARRCSSETEDEYRRLLYVAMTRAADRLIVGGCMPGNMNSVREHVLVRPDHARASPIPDCSLQEIETADGMVKRYSRPEDAAPATGAAAAPRRSRADRAAAVAADPGAAGSSSPTACCARPIPADDEGHRVRTGESLAAARARASARHAGAPAAAIAARHRRRAPPRRRAGLSRPQCRRLDRRRARSAGAKACWP